MLTLALACVSLTSCSSDEDLPESSHTGQQKSVSEILAGMTLHEKLCQMIFCRPEAFGDPNDEGHVATPVQYAVTEWADSLSQFYEQYPVGGFVLFGHNIVNETQLKSFNAAIHSLSGRPMTCVDEEGGQRATRIAWNDNFDLKRFTSSYGLGHEGDWQKVADTARYIATYVKEYGFDVDLAPVADVWTNPVNTVIGTRAYSTNPDTAARCAWAYYSAQQSVGVQGCYKHFPGHGDTSTDSHYGYADSYKTWEEMLACEMIPFKMGIDNGIEMIMSAHVRTPNVTSDGLPATLSKEMLTGKLRGELGYQGIIACDGLAMGAISNEYTVEEVAVGTVKAGIDIILLPLSLPRTVSALKEAIAKGEITESRIDESVTRILKMKRKMGLI